MPMIRQFRCWRQVRAKRNLAVCGLMFGMIVRPVIWLLRRSGLRTRRIEKANIHTGIWRRFTARCKPTVMRASTVYMMSGRIREAACWAHVRRKFFDLHQAHASPLATEAVERIGQLYRIESEIRGRPPDERQQVRDERARPLLIALHEWFKTTLTRALAQIRSCGCDRLCARALACAGALLRRRSPRNR